MTNDETPTVICKDPECARCRAVHFETAEPGPYPEIAVLTTYRARPPRTATPAR
jgi:hypothetical protein